MAGFPTAAELRGAGWLEVPDHVHTFDGQTRPMWRDPWLSSLWSFMGAQMKQWIKDRDADAQRQRRQRRGNR